MTAIAFCPSFVPSARPTSADDVQSVPRSGRSARCDARRSPTPTSRRPMSGRGEPERRCDDHGERGAEHAVGPDAVEAAPHDCVFAGHAFHAAPASPPTSTSPALTGMPTRPAKTQQDDRRDRARGDDRRDVRGRHVDRAEHRGRDRGAGERRPARCETKARAEDRAKRPGASGDEVGACVAGVGQAHREGECERCGDRDGGHDRAVSPPSRRSRRAWTGGSGRSRCRCRRGDRSASSSRCDRRSARPACRAGPSRTGCRRRRAGRRCPVSRLHGALHAVIECQMPGPTGESSLMNVSGCPASPRAACRRCACRPTRRRRSRCGSGALTGCVGSPVMSGSVASCAAVVVVLGQVPVGELAGLVDRRDERIGAAGDAIGHPHDHDPHRLVPRRPRPSRRSSRCGACRPCARRRASRGW